MNIEMIAQLFDLVIIPLLAALTVYAVKWINAQANNLKETIEKTKEALSNLTKEEDMLTSKIIYLLI